MFEGPNHILPSLRRVLARYLELTHEEQTSQLGRLWRREREGVSEKLLTEAHSIDAASAARAIEGDADTALSAIMPFDLGQTEFMHATLAAAGWTRHEAPVFVLRTGPPDPPAASDVRVLPARAMRRAYDLLARECAAAAVTGEDECAFRAAAILDRLDSPHCEAWVAMVGRRPAACASLIQAGDTGLLCDCHSRTDMAVEEPRALLVLAAAAFARRLNIQRVLYLPSAAVAARRESEAPAGFAGDATIPVYLRAGAALPWN